MVEQSQDAKKKQANKKHYPPKRQKTRHKNKQKTKTELIKKTNVYEYMYHLQ